MFRRSAMLTAVACVMVMTHPAQARFWQGDACQPQWLPTFGGYYGFNDDVHALLVFDDGTGGGATLYAAGNFTSAGGADGVPGRHRARGRAGWCGECR